MEETVTSDLQSLSDWFKVNKLSLNIGKTNYLAIGRIQRMDNYSVYLDMTVTVISRRTHVKFLGVFVGDKLNWNEHRNGCHFLQTKNSFCPVCTKNCRQYLNVEAAKIYLSIYLSWVGWLKKCILPQRPAENNVQEKTKTNIFNKNITKLKFYYIIL